MEGREGQDGQTRSTKSATAKDAEDAENTHHGRVGQVGLVGLDVRGCGGDEPWSAALQWESETATQANRRADYELFISEVVTIEAANGDPDLARQRVEICDALPLLAISDEAERLAPLLLKAAGMAPNAETDALHVAVAAVHGMEYLLSWNCTHIANANDSSRHRQAVPSIWIRPAGHLHATRAH